MLRRVLLSPDSVPSAVREWLPADFALTSPNQGQTATVAFVSTAPLVIKRACGPLYTTWLEQEHRALVALAESELPLPEAIGWYCEPGPQTESTAAWLVMRRLPGEPLAEIFAKADEATRCALYRQLGELTARVHASSIPTALKPDDPRRWFERVLERARNAPRRWGQRIAARFDRDRDPDVPETLIHGDLTIDNVMVDQGALSGILDWGGAGPGDPRYDITLALSTEDDRPLPPKVTAAFLQGYASQSLPSALRTFIERAYEIS